MSYFYLDQEKIASESHNLDYHQGQTVAYNMLGLVTLIYNRQSPCT